MLDKLYDLSQSRKFWLTGVAFLLIMEMIALYYQYALGLYPCALCVQIRAWVAGSMILALLSAFMFEQFWWRWLSLTLTTVLILGGLYTSWYAWGVEKGSIISSCTMGAGFPEAMPLDQWVPWLFSAQGICGRTPNLWFGLTMAEGLVITLAVPAIILVILWLLHLRKLLSSSSDMD